MASIRPLGYGRVDGVHLVGAHHRHFGDAAFVDRYADSLLIVFAHAGMLGQARAPSFMHIDERYDAYFAGGKLARMP
jgi:hypothetical protein